MRLARISICAVFCLTIIANSASALTMLHKPDGEGSQNALADIFRRFHPHEKNYMMWQWTEGDQQAMECQLSMKYKFNYWEFQPLKNVPAELNTYFAYTGKFDFYMKTRDSGPVINRTSNPAFHIRLETSEKGESKPEDRYWLQWLDFGVEHRSNGQVVDAKDENGSGTYLTQIEDARGNREYFDRISRGSNYLSLSVAVEPRPDLLIEVSPKLYLSQDADITWGKYAGTSTNFEDFDLVRLKGTYMFYKPKKKTWITECTIGAEYLIGKKGFKTDSLDAFIIVPLRWESPTWGVTIPLALKAHTGPMDRLSDYSRSMNSVALGFVFAY